MGLLANHRHELFAQGLAKGMTADAAYGAAGYKPNRHNAHTLTTNQNVQARLAELQERAANRVEISLAMISERLIRIADKAEALEESSGLSVARASMMDIAKLHGHVTDKLKADVNVTLESMIAESMGHAR